MAKQDGIFQIKGTIDNVTFYKTRNGYEIRKKTSFTGDRIFTDPGFERTRENMSEFARAAKAGKVFRVAFNSLVQNAKDSRLPNRLTAQMSKVIKTDAVNSRGQRTVASGMVEQMQGFNCNKDAELNTAVYAPYTATIDRATGDMTVSIPSFIPADTIVAPSGTTHFKIVSAAAEIDFDNEVSITDEKSSATLPWNRTATAALNLANSVSANSTHPLFLLLGIQFYQEVNGDYYSLKSGIYNALAVVKVSAA
jgi:hypothetical protein